MDASIVQDYKNILTRYKYLESDFTIDCKDCTIYPSNGGITPIREEITISNIKSGKSKMYKGGHMTKWLGDFEDDIKNGYYH